MYKVTEKDLIGEIRDFPIEVVQMMIDKQIEQRGKADIAVFQNRKLDGFLWNETEEGRGFWTSVILHNRFNIFFKRYSKDIQKEKLQNTTYQVKSEDSIGQLEGFPIEVVQKMIERQVEQGSEANIKVFQKRADSGVLNHGFAWAETVEKYSFWNDVIRLKSFNVFFAKYPKQTSEVKKSEHPEIILPQQLTNSVILSKETLQKLPSGSLRHIALAIGCSFETMPAKEDLITMIINKK